MARTPLGVGSGIAAGAQQARAQAPRQTANSLAGFLLGVFADVLFIQFMRGGVAQVKGWMAAKFLNRPYAIRRDGLLKGSQ